MRLIYQLVNNYGVAIVLFTIITKILLFPISYKQQKNTLRMQLIQPKLKKLQAKYKDKPQELQQAQMQLYQEEHVNPMSSCLPMFLQFFLLFGVLDVVYKPLTHILHYSKSVISRVVEISIGILGDSVAKQYTGLRQELGVLKAFQDNPSAFSNVDTFDTSKVSDFMEHFTVFGVNLGETPTWHPEVWNTSAVILFCIPLLSGILQLFMTIYMQIMQKKRGTAPEQNMGCMNVMLYVMPLFSVWFAFQVSAGVGFYWACSSFFSLLQTIGLNLYFTPERGAKIIEKENKKMEARYAAGKQSFTERVMNQNAGAARVQETEKTKNMSNRELSSYNKQKIQEARKRMAEKYGETYEEDSSDED